MSRGIKRRDFVRLAASAGTFLTLGSVISCKSEPEGLSESVLEDFGSLLKGRIITPGDSDYDQARRIWNIKYDKKPDIIVKCTTQEDVVQCLKLSATEKLPVAVRSGGHSQAGYSTIDQGMVIDLSAMKNTEFNPDKMSINVGSGMLTGDLDRITKEYHIAMVLGSCPTVGIGGFTLGGGQGLLSRRFGLGCDNLLSATVVLPSGEIVSASQDHNPDLFWALKGGGGNFGIVTSFEFNTYKVPGVLSGSLTYPVSKTKDLLRFLRYFTLSAPRELLVSPMITGTPEGPRFSVQILYLGDEYKGNQYVQPLREKKPVSDTIAYQTYHEAKTSLAPDAPPVASIMRSGFFPFLEDELIDVVVEFISKAPPAFIFSLFPMDGAVSEVEVTGTAFPIRDPGFDCFITTIWLDESQKAVATTWINEFWELMKPFTRGAYVNGLEKVDLETIKEVYGENYEKLVAVKQEYDPENYFKHNHNIEPE